MEKNNEPLGEIAERLPPELYAIGAIRRFTNLMESLLRISTETDPVKKVMRRKYTCTDLAETKVIIQLVEMVIDMPDEVEMDIDFSVACFTDMLARFDKAVETGDMETFRREMYGRR